MVDVRGDVLKPVSVLQSKNTKESRIILKKKNAHSKLTSENTSMATLILIGCL